MNECMFHKIKSVTPQGDLCLLVIFIDGTIKTYDVKQMFEKFPVFKKLKDNNLFAKVKVDCGGYGISWNDDIDIACDEIFYNGKIL